MRKLNLDLCEQWMLIITLPHSLQEEVKEKATIEDAKKEEATPEEDPKGIPEFWLTIFKSVDMLSDMLQVHLSDC